MRLTWVCRLWRYSALADPVLWGTIIFDDLYPWTRSFEFFKRAGAGDIAFRLGDRQQKDEQGRDIAPKITAPQMEMFLEKIFDKFHQIRAAIFVLDGWPAAMEVLKAFSRPAARAPRALECFELHRPSVVYVGQPWLTPGFTSPYIHNPLELFCNEAPKLQAITMNGVNIRWSSLPCVNLRTIDLRRIPPGLCPTSPDFLEMLRATHSLRRLMLDTAGAIMPNPQPYIRHPVQLPHLKEVFVGGANPAYTQWLLTHFTAPQLAMLTLSKVDFFGEAPLCSFLIGRFPQVECLALYVVRYSLGAKKPFLKWINAVSQLKVLKLSHAPREVMLEWLFEDARNYQVEEEEQQQADAAEDSPVIAPNLQALGVESQGMPDVIAFAKKRKDLGLPLERVYLSPLFRSTPEEEAELRILGVEIWRGSSHTKEEIEIENRWQRQYGP